MLGLAPKEERRNSIPKHGKAWNPKRGSVAPVKVFLLFDILGTLELLYLEHHITTKNICQTQRYNSFPCRTAEYLAGQDTLLSQCVSPLRSIWMAFSLTKCWVGWGGGGLLTATESGIETQGWVVVVWVTLAHFRVYRSVFRPSSKDPAL